MNPPRGSSPAWLLLFGASILALTSSCALPLRTLPDWGEFPAREVLEYYEAVAFGSEYGGKDDRLRTWEEELKVRVYGGGPGDLAEVEKVLRELNALGGRGVGRRVEADENVELRLTDQRGFDRHAPPEARKNSGYVHLWWSPFGTAYRARILVRNEGLTPKRRRHVIREELTQALGLLNDSWAYPDSIFYQGLSEKVEFSTLDRAVIRLHLSNRPLTGISRARFRELVGTGSPAGVSPTGSAPAGVE
jgi:hypothetical protein